MTTRECDRVGTTPMDNRKLNQSRDYYQLSLLDVLSEKLRLGTLALFVGAGVSKDAGLPLWNELVAPLRESLALPATEDAPDVAQRYVDAHGRLALLKYLEVTLGRVRTPGPMHEVLAELPVSVVVTTNYDQLLEQALARRDELPLVIARDSQIDDTLGGPSIARQGRPVIVKLHGCLSDPETIVLTRDDYVGYPRQHARMIDCLRQLLATQTFLFVGFSLTDPNFREIHRSTRRGQDQTATRSFLLDALSRPSAEVAEWRAQGVETLLFHDFDEKLAFIRRLARRAAQSPPANGVERLPFPFNREWLPTTNPR